MQPRRAGGDVIHIAPLAGQKNPHTYTSTPFDRLAFPELSIWAASFESFFVLCARPKREKPAMSI